MQGGNSGKAGAPLTPDQRLAHSQRRRSKIIMHVYLDAGGVQTAAMRGAGRKRAPTFFFAIQVTWRVAWLLLCCGAATRAVLKVVPVKALRRVACMVAVCR